jgi:hypothetical protein
VLEESSLEVRSRDLRPAS